MKRILAPLAVALLLLAVGVSSAGAATPCWKRLINDWVDGRIDGTYSTRCYQEAIRNLPPDVKIYASAEDDFRRALALAFHTREGGGFGGGGAAATDIVPSGTVSGTTDRGILRRVLDWLGPSNAEAIPTPLLVLAGIALLLLASAAASFVARRIQARRKPAPAPARPPQGP